MNIDSFVAGKFERQYHYDSFLPAPVNHDWHWSDTRINTLLETASRHLAELDAFSLIVPDIDLFIRMHTIKEASLSSRIEGTKTEMDEALLPEEEIQPERRDDWVEVNNYVNAMNYAIDTLSDFPLSNRLLRKTHEILMQGVRGETKRPGEYRCETHGIGTPRRQRSSAS